MTTRNPSWSSRVIAVVAVAGLFSLAAGASVAQAARWIPSIATIGHSMLAQEDAVPSDVRQGPLSPEDQALVTRWSELFAAVLGEFRADHRDPTANIEGDFATREIRVRRIAGTGAWVGRTLTKKDLATVDVRAFAKKLYEESKR